MVIFDRKENIATSQNYSLIPFDWSHYIRFSHRKQKYSWTMLSLVAATMIPHYNTYNHIFGIASYKHVQYQNVNTHTHNGLEEHSWYCNSKMSIVTYNQIDKRHGITCARSIIHAYTYGQVNTRWGVNKDYLPLGGWIGYLWLYHASGEWTETWLGG